MKEGVTLTTPSLQFSTWDLTGIKKQFSPMGYTQPNSIFNTRFTGGLNDRNRNIVKHQGLVSDIGDFKKMDMMR